MHLCIYSTCNTAAGNLARWHYDIIMMCQQAIKKYVLCGPTIHTHTLSLWVVTCDTWYLSLSSLSVSLSLCVCVVSLSLSLSVCDFNDSLINGWGSGGIPWSGQSIYCMCITSLSCEWVGVVICYGNSVTYVPRLLECNGLLDTLWSLIVNSLRTLLRFDTERREGGRGERGREREEGRGERGREGEEREGERGMIVNTGLCLCTCSNWTCFELSSSLGKYWWHLDLPFSYKTTLIKLNLSVYL